MAKLNVYTIVSGEYPKLSYIHLTHDDKFTHKQFRKLFNKTVEKLIKKDKGKDKESKVKDPLYQPRKIADRMCKKYGFKYMKNTAVIQIFHSDFDSKYDGFNVTSHEG